MTAQKPKTPEPTSAKTPIIKVTKPKQDLRKKEPPLVEVKVTNPLSYLKTWWRRIIGNEGIDLRFRVRPLTAIAISIIIVTVSAGIGKFVFPFKIPFFVYTSQASPTPTPTPNPWRQTAFSGVLRFTGLTERYYLSTSSAEAITLEVPQNIDLSQLTGKRIFATGSYNPDTRILKVEDAADLEILPEKIEPIPLLSPSPSPTSSPSPSPSGEAIETVSPSPTP